MARAPEYFLNNPAPNTEGHSFLGTVLDTVGQGLIPQAAQSLGEAVMPAEEGYQASPQELKGFEPYAEWFNRSGSAAQTEAIKERIRANEAASQRIDKHGGFWTGVAAGALDPINLAIPMLGEGAGALRGALLSGVAGALGTGAQTWATSKVSPTATSDPWADMLYGGLFAGVLGGYFGRSGRAVAHEYGGLLARELQAQDARLGGVSMEAGVEPPKPVSGAPRAVDGLGTVSHESESVGAGVEAGGNVIQFPGAHNDPNAPVAMAAHGAGDGKAIMGNLALKLEEENLPHIEPEKGAEGLPPEEPPKKGGEPPAGGAGGGEEPPKGPEIPGADAGKWKVEPTGPGGYGLAPAYGMEKLLAKLTLGTRMISTGLKPVGDLVQRMIGEGSVLTTDNLKGIASPNSVFLASKRWTAMAMDAETSVKRIWSELRGHATPIEISGGNLTAGMTQMADAWRGVTRGTNPGNMPTLGQFKEMLFRARVAQDPQAYLQSLDPAIAAAVQKGLPVLHQFYEQAGLEAVRTGVLPSEQFLRGQALRDQERLTQLSSSADALMAKGAEMTANEAAELHFTLQAKSAMMDKLARFELSGIITDQEMADVINDIQAKGKARQDAAVTLADKIRAQLVTHYESQVVALNQLEERAARGQSLSPRQTQYLQDLRERLGTGAEPNAFREAVDAYKHTNPIEPFSTRDPKFNPPANDHGTIVDRWEDRRDHLAQTNPEKMAQWFEDHNLPEAAARVRAEPSGHGDLEWTHEAGVDALEAETRKHVDQIAGAHAAEAQTYLSGKTDGATLPEALRVHLDDVKQAHADALDDLNRHYSEPQDLKTEYRDGVPTVFDMFHGTKTGWIWDAKQNKFIHFDNDKLGQNTGAGSATLAHFGARDPRTAQAPDYINPKNAKEAAEHAPNVIMARGRMENPKVIDYKGAGYEEQTFNDDIAAAKAAGHDGVILKNAFDGGPQDVIYAIFDSANIRYRFDAGAKKVEAATGVKIEGRPSQRAAANSNRPDAEKLATPKQRELLAQLDERASGPMLSKAQDAYIKDMLQQIESGKVELPKHENDPAYINRVWNHDAVHQNTDKLRGIFEQWYREQGGVDPKLQADRSIAAILDHDPTTQLSNPNGGTQVFRPSPAQARKFDIPTERIVDFLHTDTGHLMHDYARAFGSGIESAKAFGDPFASDALHDVNIQSAKELTGTTQQIIGQVENNGRQLEFARDAMLGRQRAGTPLTVDAALARGIKNFVSTTSLGSVGLSALTEAARPIMTRGLMDTIGATFDILSNRNADPVKLMGRQLAMLGGEVGELAHGMSGSRVMEMGGTPSRLGSETAMAIDRKLAPFNELSEKQFYVANGLALVTDFLKNWSQLLSAHFMVRDIQDLAAGRASQKAIKNLAGYTIDADVARRMLATDAFDKSGRVNIVDLGKFDDPELVMKFSQAVQMEVRRTINTPGYFDKSMVQQGFYFNSAGERKEAALATLPFQFMSWGIAANNKVLMSALQGRDASAFMGVASLTGMAYFVNWLKYGGNASWMNMSAADKLAMAVEQSGALAQFEQLNNIIEAGSMNTFGARPLLGLGPKWGVEQDGLDAAAAPFGPAAGKAIDIYKAFDPNETQDQRASIIRRSVPFNGLPYFKGVFKTAQDATLGAYNSF